MGEMISPMKKKLFFRDLFPCQYADYPVFTGIFAGKKACFRQFCDKPKAQFLNKGKGMAVRLWRQPVQGGKHILTAFIPAQQKAFHHITPYFFLLAKGLPQKTKMYHCAFAQLVIQPVQRLYFTVSSSHKTGVLILCQNPCLKAGKISYFPVKKQNEVELIFLKLFPKTVQHLKGLLLCPKGLVSTF